MSTIHAHCEPPDPLQRFPPLLFLRPPASDSSGSGKKQWHNLRKPGITQALKIYLQHTEMWCPPSSIPRTAVDARESLTAMTTHALQNDRFISARCIVSSYVNMPRMILLCLWSIKPTDRGLDTQNPRRCIYREAFCPPARSINSHISPPYQITPSKWLYRIKRPALTCFSRGGRAHMSRSLF